MKSKRIVKTPKKVKNVKAPMYAFGGSAHDPLNDYLMLQQQKSSNMPNQIESPDTTLADNEIRLARAAQKAASNPWTQGLDMFGNLAMQVGSSLMSQGASKGQGVSKGGFNWGGLMQQGIGAMGTYANSSFATGGVANKVPINAEGEEVIETPNGQVAELQGPSHAQGGIDMQVPEGTEIYSKRLKGPDGKSMADRKKARERQLSRLEKLAESNPTDKTIKKTLDKTKKDFQIQEQQDMQKMQMMHQMTQVQQAMEHFATGGTAGKPLPVFNWMNWGKNWGNSFMPGESGGIPTGHDIVPFYNYGDDYGDPDGNKHPYSGSPSNNKDGIISLSDDELNNPTNDYGPMPKLSAGKTVADMKGYYSDEEIADMGDDPNAKTDITQGKSGILNKIFGQEGGLSMEDMIGLGGQLYSTFAPMKNTQANRAGDTPNVNAFKNYGKDALAKMDQSKQYVNQVRDENLKDLELARTGQISRNRNSARGLNTQRALDLTADANVNDTKSKIFSQFAQAMQGIYGQEATLENDQDKYIMTYEQQRDENDRKDRDNYFSQMAQDIATKGTGLQHTGKNANAIKERNVKGKVMNSMYNDFKDDIYSGDISKHVTNTSSPGHEFIMSLPPKLRKRAIDGEFDIIKGKLYKKGTKEEIKIEE